MAKGEIRLGTLEIVPGSLRTRTLAMDTSQFPEILRQDHGDQALSNPALALQ